MGIMIQKCNGNDAQYYNNVLMDVLFNLFLVFYFENTFSPTVPAVAFIPICHNLLRLSARRRQVLIAVTAVECCTVRIFCTMSSSCVSSRYLVKCLVEIKVYQNQNFAELNVAVQAIMYFTTRLQIFPRVSEIVHNVLNVN